VFVELVRNHELNNEKPDKEFELDWIYTQYEDGEAVAKIAKILGRSESYVYAQMKQRPKEYEDIKKVLEEKHNRRIRRIRGLADRHIEEFLEGLDKQQASEKIETINRISKDTSSRVQLSDGKATENIGVGGMNRPFSVLITKTYASKEKGSDD
jgi:hypothetical protein